MGSVIRILNIVLHYEAISNGAVSTNMSGFIHWKLLTVPFTSKHSQMIKLEEIRTCIARCIIIIIILVINFTPQRQLLQNQIIALLRVLSVLSQEPSGSFFLFTQTFVPTGSTIFTDDHTHRVKSHCLLHPTAHPLSS